MSIYEQIQKDNIVKYGTECEKILQIIINQYSDRTHFIYEIIQNAEDAKASYIKFHLTKNSLEIFHDGRPFDEKDIVGICGIADGTKEDGTRIGHFGIGFKSVYCYTNTPQIYSGKYHFKIENRIFPYEIGSRTGLSPSETCMVLPFNLEAVSKDIAYLEIKDALISKITSSSIIMLDSIKNVGIEIDDYINTISIEKIKNKLESVEDCDIYALGITTKVCAHSAIVSVTDEDYLFFSNRGEEKCAIVYKTGGKDGKQLIPIKNAKVYAFFPTAREAHQNFYIHAPFDTTPARDNFKEGAEYGKHNHILMDSICDLITGALLWMRDAGYLNLAGIKTAFPIYEYENTDLLYSIYQNSIDIISNGIELLPTNRPGVFKSIENIFEPMSAVIVDVFDDDDLHSLVQIDKYWLAKDIASEAYIDFRVFLKNNFKIDTLGWPSLVPRITARFLERKDVSWIELLMEKIESYCIKKSYSNHYLDVSNIPFIRTADRRHICARDEKGQLQVYLNNHESAKYKIAEAFLKSSSIVSFFRNALQIPEFNKEQEVIEKVLPKYRSSDVKLSIQENIEDLKAIKNAIHCNHTIIDAVKNSYVVTDGTGWFKPEDLFIFSTETRTGFNLFGTENFKFLSESYFEDAITSLTLDERFFKSIGCNSSIRGIYAKTKDYLAVVKKYVGWERSSELDNKIFSKQYISGDLKETTFYYDGLESLLNNVNFQQSQSIARFLSSNITQFTLKTTLHGADDQHFSGKNVDTVSEFTMMGLFLSYGKWIFVNGCDEPQRPIDVDRDDVRAEYKQSKKIIDILPFKEEKSALAEQLSTILDGDNVEIAMELFSSPANANDFFKAFAKSKAKEEKKKEKQKNLEELLKARDKGQIKRKDDGQTELEVNPITEKGIERRSEKLDEILAESMGHQIYAAKGLTFSRRESNAAEREFLASEYNGFCQLCGKQIVKYDGDVYFEAINIMRESDMKDELLASRDLAWNSLCLCPNCAAEYNYCSKKISSLYEQVTNKDIEPESDEPIEIEIEIPEGKRRKLIYSPRHFLALKKAFLIFTQNKK